MGIAAQRQRQLGEPLADACAATGPAEHRAALGRIPGRRRPHLVDQQVRDRGRRQQRLVPARGQLDPALRPPQPPGQLRVHRLRVDVLEVAGRAAGPGRARTVRGLGVELQGAVGLVVAQAQSGRRGEVGGDELVVGEAVQLTAAGTRACERLAQRRGEVGEDGGRGLGGRVREVRGLGHPRHQRIRVLRRFGAVCGGLGGPYQGLQLARGDGGTGDDTGRGALLAVDGRDDGEGASAGHPVRGERVARPAQIGSGSGVLVGDDDAPVRAGQFEGALDDLVRLVGTGGHRPASCVVFRMLTPLKRADGQPCETARYLAGLGLAAVEGTAEDIGLRTRDGRHGTPEVGGRRLVGDVPQLTRDAPVLDLEEPLTGELEVVALHVDGPGAVPDDVDAAVRHRSDPRWTARPDPAGARRWPCAAPARARASRRTRSRWDRSNPSAWRCGGPAGSPPASRP